MRLILVSSLLYLCMYLRKRYSDLQQQILACYLSPMVLAVMVLSCTYKISLGGNVYVTLEIPEVPDPAAATAKYVSRFYFVGSPSTNRDINALASTFVRLVEAASIEYQLGAKALEQFWTNHKSMELRSMNRSVSHFESCISETHRSIRTYRALRNHKSRDPLSIFLGTEKPQFSTDAAARQIRVLRDAIHHLDDKLVKGEIADGESYSVRPDGPEVPHPIEKHQTVKTVDRLVVGKSKVLFRDLSAWIREMQVVATKVSDYVRPSTVSSA